MQPQTEPCAGTALLLDTRHAVESLPDMRPLLRGETGTVIAHGDLGRAALHTQRHLDGSV